jgi:hypothetical protein
MNPFQHPDRVYHPHKHPLTSVNTYQRGNEFLKTVIAFYKAEARIKLLNF